MITNVPNHEDFRNEGRILLNLAWDELRRVDSAINDFLSFPKVDEERDDLDDLEIQWVKEDIAYRKQMHLGLARSIQRPLGVCRTLIAQAAEFLLKAKIAEVSPFILLKNDHSKWPGKDQSYSEFQTVDAGDLVRVCNSVLKQPLPDSFVNMFDILRKDRNVYVHGVTPPTSVPLSKVCEEPLRLILKVAQHLANENWRDTRAWFVANYDTDTILTHGDHISDYMAYEMAWLIQQLEPSESERYLNFHPKKGGRNYLCPSCYHGEYDYIREATFSKVADDQAFCFVCNTKHPITRQPCPKKDCKGDVIYTIESMCLTCGAVCESASF
ncbi:hypothetical protein EA187_09210 [Lujinxingia sediminis]|uniref:Uncharacterized protein n=1 Tax=Lujinxingia sediminis TaxID=2480984 RepID=A0ABY0CSZ1_9DELT|nr:hypothetical protein [Lujinxingia sediminis]RVU44711.1 hypothetical protein EA187_09210 [Lujinxingia sediminis]